MQIGRALEIELLFLASDLEAVDFGFGQKNICLVP